MGLWSKLHAITLLPAFLLFAILAYVLARLLKDKEDKIKNLPFQIITVFILIIEIIKQILSFDNGVYDTYALPFHYCSLFLYLLPLHSFYKGKYKELVERAMFICGTSLLFMMLVVPTVIYGESAISEFMKNYSATHTVVFHNVVSFYVMLMIAFKTHTFNLKKDAIVSAIFLSIYFVIATILSYSFDVNFHNIKHCNLDAIENIRCMLVDGLGTFGQVIYIIILYIGTLLVAMLSAYIVKLLVYLFNLIKTKIFKKS